MTFKKISLTVSAFLFLSEILFPVAYADDDIDFDVTTLQARGLSTSLNDYFRSGTKFSPGVSKVTPVINGTEQAVLGLTFDEKGELCLHNADLSSLHIKPIKNEEDRCIDLKSKYPQATINLSPGSNKVDLLLPPEAVEDANNLDISSYQTGGTAALFNYDMLMMRNHTKSDGNDDSDIDNDNKLSTFQSNTEIGFNFDDWIIRSRQSYSSTDGEQTFDQLYTYAQRTLPQYKTIMQAGKVNIAGGVFSTPQIYGVQFSPEQALINNKSSGASVNGIAQTQARVEVRQAGVMIYSTQVPSGPFQLDHLSTLNNTADLQVSVIEQDGSTRTFVVPASSFAHHFSQQETSFSGAIGKLDESDNNDGVSGSMATLSMTTPFSSRAMFSGGVLLAQQYESTAAQLSTGLESGLALSGKLTIANDQRNHVNGVQSNVSASMPVGEQLTVQASATLQNSGYRDLTDGKDVDHEDDHPGKDDDDNYNDQYNRYKSQYNAGMAYRLGELGSINMAWSRATMFGDDGTTDRWTAGWSKTFTGGISVSVNAERDTGADAESLVYANMSIPFGSFHIGANMSRVGDSTNQGITLDQTLNERVNYSLSAYKNSNGDTNTYNGNLHAITNSAQLSLGYSRYDQDSNTYSLGATGGVVATKQGVLFTPYQVQDTFAVVQIPGVSNGEVQTPQGSVWTNRKGYAVSSGMNAYGESRLVLVTKSLPKNVDINNGIQIAHVARGSVTDYTFGTVLSRRALIRIYTANGHLANRGDVVTDSHDNYLTTVGGDGTVFLIDGQLEQQLVLKSSGQPRCHVAFTLAPKPDADKLYETYDAQCKL